MGRCLREYGGHRTGVGGIHRNCTGDREEVGRNTGQGESCFRRNGNRSGVNSRAFENNIIRRPCYRAEELIGLGYHGSRSCPRYRWRNALNRADSDDRTFAGLIRCQPD